MSRDASHATQTTAELVRVTKGTITANVKSKCLFGKQWGTLEVVVDAAIHEEILLCFALESVQILH